MPKEVEVVWRRPGSFAPIRLGMMATVASGPGDDGNEDHWRLVHPNVEIRVTGAAFTLTMADPVLISTTYRTFVQLQALERLLGSTGQVHLSIHWMRRRLVEWQHDTPLKLRSPSSAEALGEILRQLGVVLTAAGLQDAKLPTGSWVKWQKDLYNLCVLLEEPNEGSMSVAVDVPDDGAPGGHERESLFVTALELGDCYLACYATCRGQIDRENASSSSHFRMHDFEVRELRLVEKSDEAMHAFNDEARATTGLGTGFAQWGPNHGGATRLT